MANAKQIAAAIDMAFAAGDFPKWRGAIVQRRSEFAWSAQDVIYANEMSRYLDTTPNTAAGAL